MDLEVDLEIPLLLGAEITELRFVSLRVLVDTVKANAYHTQNVPVLHV